LKPFGREQIALMQSLADDPALMRKFFGVLTGIGNPMDLFSPQRVFQILGMRGMAKLMLSRVLPQQNTG
jgi:hypothetical protein